MVAIGVYSQTGSGARADAKQASRRVQATESERIGATDCWLLTIPKGGHITRELDLADQISRRSTSERSEGVRRRADLGMPGQLAQPGVQAFPDPPSEPS